MEPQVTNRELARRMFQLMPVVLLGVTALWYTAGIDLLILLWLEVLMVLFAAIVIVQFMRRGQQQEDMTRERLVIYFIAVPVVMAGVSLIYVWLGLPAWILVSGFPFAILGLNSLYSISTRGK